MSGARKYLRASGIAALTGVSLRTVRRWIKDEILPSTKVRGIRIVATEDLETLLSGLSSLIDSEIEEILDVSDDL